MGRRRLQEAVPVGVAQDSGRVPSDCSRGRILRQVSRRIKWPVAQLLRDLHPYEDDSAGVHGRFP